ncbi:hypothetical protein MKEN_00656200 [Mycena kentingensis (nom. inval.)]|nr:hypothetical protein MKEN_00656200 [Mycena kentingensis (nom. inval.)]
MHANVRRDPFHNLRLAAFFAAISRAEGKLAKQYDDGKELKEVLASRLIKAIEGCIPVEDDAEAELHCIGMVKNQPFLLLFKRGAHTFIVKFLRGRYGEAHHKAMERFAPRLHDVVQLMDGWKMVVMDHVDGLSASDPDFIPTSDHLDQLDQLGDALAAKGIVHGDLRDANIMVSDESLRLVDWDWSGQAEVDRYPIVELSPEASRSPDAIGGCIMRVDHDKQRLEALRSKWESLMRRGIGKRKRNDSSQGIAQASGEFSS